MHVALVFAALVVPEQNDDTLAPCWIAEQLHPHILSSLQIAVAACESLTVRWEPFLPFCQLLRHLSSIPAGVPLVLCRLHRLLIWSTIMFLRQARAHIWAISDEI